MKFGNIEIWHSNLNYFLPPTPQRKRFSDDFEPLLIIVNYMYARAKIIIILNTEFVLKGRFKNYFGSHRTHENITNI